MRAIIGALVLIGGGVLATAFVMSVAAGNGSETEWILLGPMPFWVIGLIGYLRQPRHRVVWWLVGISVLFSCDVALGDLFLPAATAGQLARRRLEHAADRWILGPAGYASLNRFGESLTLMPGSDELVRELTGQIRRGLSLTWVRVTLDAPGGQPQSVTGPRADGALLAEDRRLLEYFATQAAVGVHNLYLAAELSQQVNLIQEQAAELTASRDRIVAGQDAERRRIQAVLHDGVQQEIVALSAQAGLARQQLLRGDPAAASVLADMQRDLATALRDVREIAYAIHPPVLADRGLLEAIEVQSSRLAVPMAVRADPSLRGVRFPETIETTAWYVLSEALANMVKHAAASEVEVWLDRQDGHLGLVIRDDGCGFDPEGPRGLGLTGLADRLGTVGGSVTITSATGQGTSVRVNIPVSRDAADA